MDGGVREIPLTRGKVALVDAADFEWLSAWKWYFYDNGRGNSYANRSVAKATVYMHRVIMQPEPGLMVDHINGDGLDNRRANLRCCTNKQNIQNQHRRFNKTGFKGVAAVRNRYLVQIKPPEGKRIASCGFLTAEEAAREYDRLALIHHGEFARLNFPRAA